MSWSDLLIKDLENVKAGKKEAGEDVTRLQNVIDSIDDARDRQSVAMQLIEAGCGYFAGTLMAGNYDRTEAEGGTSQAEETKADS